MFPNIQSPGAAASRNPASRAMHASAMSSSRSPRPGRSMRGGRATKDMTFPNAYSRAIERDEEKMRDNIMMEYALETNSLDSESFHYSTASFRRSVDKMVKQVTSMQQEQEQSRTTQQTMISSVDALNGQVQSLGHVLGILSDVHTESVKAQMMDLRVENATLQKQVEDLKYQLELQKAQCASLKGTLRGNVARAREQVEELRDEVRMQVSQEAIDLQGLKKDLMYRFDAVTAALTFVKSSNNNSNTNTTGQQQQQQITDGHNYNNSSPPNSPGVAPPTTPPTNPARSLMMMNKSENNNNNTFKHHAFDPRLSHLSEGVVETNRLIEARYNQLRDVLHSIKVSDECSEALSIHSNIPSSFRKALTNFSQEELITLLDTLSFEPGVVSAIGAAVFAKHSTVTGSPIRSSGGVP